MKRSYSNYVLWALVAVLLLGFYTIDFQSDRASVFSMPDISDLTMEQAGGDPAPVLAKFNDAIVEIADRTIPSVVTVTVTQTVEAQRNPLSLFFGNPRGGEPRQFQRQGLGSGVIVSEEGYILTNNHVVANADEIEVKLYSDQRYDAKVIGTDPQTDIAVLKIDANGLNPIPLGNSGNLRVAELVLAIGSPLDEGLAHSVSMGIVSAKGRAIGILRETSGYENFIQTDAAINPGNSGGALVNMNGELVGINTAIASQSGGNQGIGFAVPVNIAKRVMESIIEHGRVIRGYLGIYLGAPVDDVMARALGLEKALGILVGDVREGGPADEAGIEKGDVIQTINGTPIESWETFRTVIGTSSPGTEIELGIVRDGEKETYTVTLGEMPQDMLVSQNQPQNQDVEEETGFRVQNLTPEISAQLDLSEDVRGVVVTDISRTSNAYRQGLRRGAVITAVNREPVSTVSEFNSMMNEAAKDEDAVVLLNVVRNGLSQFIAFEL